MIDTDTKHKDEIIERPAKAWRNWYVALEEFSCTFYQQDRAVGEVHPGTRLWPSKETAESGAAACEGNPKYPKSLYLGAYPEGTRP